LSTLLTGGRFTGQLGMQAMLIGAAIAKQDPLLSTSP
jgi:hypothetical protein